ncbi:nucleoside/nucleotide kinase family protein [Arthrobacter sp. Sr33]
MISSTDLEDGEAMSIDAVMPRTMTYEDLVLRARALAGSGKRSILGIAGAPGAGKSTLAERLVASLGPGVAVLVSMDGFHYANRVLEDLGRGSRKGAIDTFDDGGYSALLERLHTQTGDSEPYIYAPEFRRELEEPIGSAIPVHYDVPLVVTEGNYLLQPTGHWPRARSVMEDTWHLAPPEEVRHQQLIKRHELFGKTHDEARAWARGTDEVNARLIAQSAKNAHLVVRLDSTTG